MATTAQVIANRANAQLSTGPNTAAGKAAASQNATSHGLSGTSFTLLPHESAEDFDQLVQSLHDEFEPATATEQFLITEMVRAQWKLCRIDAIEAAVFAGAAQSDDPWAGIAQQFQSATGDALLKLDRYATAARRTWHKALDTLLKLRSGHNLEAERASRIERNVSEAAIDRILGTAVSQLPLAIDRPRPNYQTKPIPQHLERELAAHKRRDPLFDPKHDASQMSKELRKWFEAV